MVPRTNIALCGTSRETRPRADQDGRPPVAKAYEAHTFALRDAHGPAIANQGV
jgi:hypothetical protein